MSPGSRRQLIPTGAWITAGVFFVLIFLLMGALFVRENHAPVFFAIVIPPVVAVSIASYILLIGYVYGDAKRRGMRYVMWTWLAILIPNAIGIILYFIMRDPMPVYCSKCGGTMAPGYAYCPHCGSGMAPSCPKCQRVTQAGWCNCAFCGTRL